MADRTNSWLIINLSRSSPTFPILIPHPHLLPIAICTVGMAADSKAKWTDRKWHRSTALRATSAVDLFFSLRDCGTKTFFIAHIQYVSFPFLHRHRHHHRGKSGRNLSLSCVDKTQKLRQANSPFFFCSVEVFVTSLRDNTYDEKACDLNF